MNYELAKELHDSGFKYGAHLHRAYKEDGTFRTLGDKPTDNYIYEPTLEELIEACGEDFDALFSHFSSILEGDENKHWRADATDRTGYSVVGFTPQEAIARLYLVLNKKV